MLRSFLAVPVLLGLAAPALAAPGADLQTTITEPVGVHVYESGTWTVTVDNVGNRHASDVELVIGLPETGTSPTVHVMGTLGAVDPACSQVGTTLQCSLGRVRRGDAASVSFDIALPASATSLVVEAAASTSTTESNPADDADSVTATLLDYAVTFVAPAPVTNDHCTGRTLSSFFECELYPSSITSHDTTLNADHSITFAGGPVGYTGTWASSGPEHLWFEYRYNGGVVATFEGYGVDATCWEGLTDFGNGWVAPYRVCQ